MLKIIKIQAQLLVHAVTVNQLVVLKLIKALTSTSSRPSTAAFRCAALCGTGRL